MPLKIELFTSQDYNYLRARKTLAKH